MRLMIIGSLNGQISTAGKIAIGRGAKVTHTEDGKWLAQCVIDV